MFCPKCGTPYEEGDLFCGKCGAALQARTVYTKPFESSETERIEDAKPGAEMSRQFAQAAAGVGDAVKKLNIDFKGKVPEGLKDYLRLGVTKPIDAVQLGTDSDKFTSSLGIIGVKDIILSLLTVFSIAGLISSVTSHYGYSGFQVMKELDMSAPKVFFTLLFLFIVLDFVVMMSLFGLGKLFKGEGSVKDWISTAGACFILPFATQIVGILLCSLRSSSMFVIAGLVIAAGSLISMVLWIKALEKRMKLSGNSLLFGYTAGMIIGWIIEGIIMYSILDKYIQALSHYF